MNGQPEMRASDRDRQQLVERLRDALEDGRLQMEEFVNRMGLAYQAQTYGDLAPLCADLPAVGATTRPKGAPPVPAGRACEPSRDAFAGLPTTLKVLWTIWLTVVSINVVVWALVSATTAHLLYPWPLWVAGPYGAALLAVSAGVAQIRRNRVAAGRRRAAQA